MAKNIISPEKARQILHDGQIGGVDLTDKQRRFFGARASGYPVKKENGGEMTDDRIEDMLNDYIIAALWSSDDDEGNPLDSNYSREDIAPDTVNRMRRDIRRFVEENLDLLNESGLADEQIGHDLWLTRNHHGAGFWDRDIPRNVGKELTESAHEMKEAILEIGDDGKIHQLGGIEFKKGGEAKSSFWDYYANHGAIITGGSYLNTEKKGIGGVLVGFGLGTIGGYAYRNEIAKVKEKAKHKITSEVDKLKKGGSVSESEIPDDVYWALYEIDQRLVDSDLDIKKESNSYVITIGKAKEGTDDRHVGTDFTIAKGEGVDETLVWNWINSSKYSKGGKVYPQKRMSMTKRGRGIDSKVPAKKAGWRKSKQTGDWYFERRENRSDRSSKNKR